MSVVAVRAALETALAAMSPALPTNWENVEFTPTPGAPYQRVAVLFAEPENSEISSRYTERGFMQVTLAYPLQTGPADAAARAQLIRTAFYRGRSLTPVSGITTTIERTPEIAPAFIDGDRYSVPVRIPFSAQVAA